MRMYRRTAPPSGSRPLQRQGQRKHATSQAARRRRRRARRVGRCGGCTGANPRGGHRSTLGPGRGRPRGVGSTTVATCGQAEGRASWPTLLRRVPAGWAARHLQGPWRWQRTKVTTSTTILRAWTLLRCATLLSAPPGWASAGRFLPALFRRHGLWAHGLSQAAAPAALERAAPIPVGALPHPGGGRGGMCSMAPAIAAATRARDGAGARRCLQPSR